MLVHCRITTSLVVVVVFVVTVIGTLSSSSPLSLSPSIGSDLTGRTPIRNKPSPRSFLTCHGLYQLLASAVVTLSLCLFLSFARSLSMCVLVSLDLSLSLFDCWGLSIPLCICSSLCLCCCSRLSSAVSFGTTRMNVMISMLSSLLALFELWSYGCYDG